MIVIAGEPRSLQEMDFIAGMYPCEACGDWRPVAWRTGGTGSEWLVRAACPRCASERAFSFTSAQDLTEADPADNELGDGTSTILEPFDFVREIDRLVPTLVISPERLVGDDWEHNHLAIDRVRTALAELAKFLVGDAIPVERFTTGHGHTDRASRPERYQRAWINDERAYWDDIAKKVALDAPRIFAAQRAKAPRGTLDPDAFAKHRLWRESRGARGERLVVVTADASRRVVRGADLAGSRLEKISLVGADLVGTDLTEAELIDVDLARARMETATLANAQLRRCTAPDLIGEATSFAGAQLEHCDFSRGLLATSIWSRATVERGTFAKADIADARLDLAHFVGCDFRGASLAGTTLAGAVLEDCDLRDADLSGTDLRATSFIRCAFAGAIGPPIDRTGWLVVDADFSDRADATDVGTADDLAIELSSARA
ncbi:MAG: pentapeptide repeat-containing protein [Kofleriaceae bacterium]